MPVSGPPGEPPFPDSLCHRCAHLRWAGNRRGSVFLACAAPGLPKYGPQPVRACRGFAPRTDGPGAPPGPGEDPR